MQAAYGLGCAGVRPFAVSTFRGHRAEWVNCPSGSENDSGHVLLEWRTGSYLYGVSAHGHTHLNRALARYVSAHLRLVTAH
jgi:hypothetical protein